MSADHHESQTAPRGTYLLRAGLLILLVGIATTGYMLISTWGLLSGLMSNPVHPVPGDFEQELEEGSYLLSVQTTFSTSAGPFYVSRGQAIDVAEVVVTGPDGAVLETRGGQNQLINRNGDGFSGVVVFDVLSPGVHQFRVVTSSETNALVTESLPAFSLRLFVVSALGGISVVVGALLAAIGWGQRRNHRTPEAHWSPPPAAPLPPSPFTALPPPPPRPPPPPGSPWPPPGP